MAKFKAKEPTFYDGRLISAGEVFDYVGEPGDNLEPVDDDARAVFEAAAAKRRVEAQRLARGVLTEGAVSFDSSALELKIEETVGRVNAVDASAKAAAAKIEGDIAELDAGLAAAVTKLDAIAAELAALKALANAPAPAAPAAEPVAAPEPAPADPAPPSDPVA